MKLNKTSVLCLASFVLSLSASAAFTRLATETYPGGGGGPTGGVTKAYVDAHDLATLFASTNYTDAATNALDLAHLAALAATNTALRSVLAASAASSTNYTDNATNALDVSHQSQMSQLSQAATNYTDSVKTNYLPLAGGTMTGDLALFADDPSGDSKAIVFENENGPTAKIYHENAPGHERIIFDTGYSFGGDQSGFEFKNEDYSSTLLPDNSPVVTSNMLNGVLGPATNALQTALVETNALLRAALDNEAYERQTADAKFLTKDSTSYPETRKIKWSGYDLVLEEANMRFKSWDKVRVGNNPTTAQQLPDYLKDGAWNTATPITNRFAKIADVDSSTLTATNFVKANYLPLDGRVGMTGCLMMNYNSVSYPSIKFTRDNEQTPDYDFSIVDDTEVYYTTAFAFTDMTGGRQKSSYLVVDDSPVVTSNMLNVVLGPEIADVKRYSETNSYPFALGNMVSNTVSQWEGYWNGSNVYWSVTNYLEAGNAKIMHLYEIQTNGVHREIWNDSDKYDIFFTNTLDAVSSTNAFTREWVGTFVTNSLDAKADRAWGKYTSSGYDVPDTNMVWHTAPTTVFAGGFEFQKVAVAGGEIGVLVSQGAVPYAAGAEGKFIIGDGFGTNYFGYVKKDDYIIATRVDGIEVDQTTKMVTLTYDLVFSGEYPIVYCSPTVIPVTAQTWIQLNKADGTLTPGAPWPVTFSTGAGYIKAHISFASATAEMPPEGFFTSSTAVIGGGTFKTNMKADFLDAGIMCTNTDTKVMGVIRPTFDGTTVHWNWSKQ